MLRRMYPTLGDLLGTHLPIGTHEFFVGLGVLVACIVFVAQVRHDGVRDDRIYVIVTGALVGGALLMRMGTWLQHIDLRENATVAEQWLYGNRSILGGLVGAWAGVHIAKALVGWKTRTGHLFAPAVAAGMAVGRCGCGLTECPGTPNHLGFGPVLDEPTAARLNADAGVPLHPSLFYEAGFHALAFGVLWFVLRDRMKRPADTFVLYIAAYALFRFLVEFVRGNEVVWQGLTRPQLFLACTLPLLAARLVWMWRQGHLELLPRPQRTTTPTPQKVTR